MLRLPSRLAFLPALTVACAAAVVASCSAPPSPAAPEPAPAPTKAAKAKPGLPPVPEPSPAPSPAKATVGPSNQFKVTAARTPFYNYGPQQPGGPNLSLDRGTVVTLLKRGFGYSQVKLRNEQTGYVGTEDIVALTVEELLAQDQPEAPVAGDLGPLPRPGGVRRSILPPATPVDLPSELPLSTEPAPKSEGAPKPGE
jgi:hypothetical protein